MYRIVRIANRFNLGGPTYNVAYLTRYLAPEFETLLVGGTKDETEADSEFILHQNGITPIVIPELRRSVSPTRDIIAYRKLKAIISDFKPHIVHTHAAKAGALGRRAAFACKVPITVHTFHGHVFHSYFGNMQTAFYKNIERRLAKRTTALIALSEMQKHELTHIHHIAPPDKFHVVPLGFDLERFGTDKESKRKLFRTTWQLQDDETAVGLIGRLVPIKNHALFLQVFKQVKSKGAAKIKAFIIGDGELRETLQALCTQLNLSFTGPEAINPLADIVFTSWLKEADIACAGLDVVALTSLNEGTPVSLIEAQAAGRPIVSVKTGGIEDVVIPEVTALLSPTGNIEAFADNLYKILTDATLRSRLSLQGPNFAMEHFHYSMLVKNMGSLYNTLLKQANLPIL